MNDEAQKKWSDSKQRFAVGLKDQAHRTIPDRTSGTNHFLRLLVRRMAFVDYTGWPISCTVGKLDAQTFLTNGPRIQSHGRLFLTAKGYLAIPKTKQEDI